MGTPPTITVVTADGQTLELVPERSRAVGQAGLGGGVRRHARNGRQRGERRHVDQVAAAASQHARHGLAAELERRGEVELDLALDLLRRALPERPVVGEAGVVHEHVDRSGFVLHAVHQAVPLLGVEQVSGVRRAAELGGQRLEGGAVACDQGDRRTGAGEGGGQGSADASRRSGDQDSLARQLHGVLLVSAPRT